MLEIVNRNRSNRPDIETFARLYKDSTPKDIAKMYGVAVRTVYQWAYEYRKMLKEVNVRS